MAKLSWYKRYPGDAVIGMHWLSSDQYKGYGIALDMMYLRANRLSDDDHLLARTLGWNVQRWRRVKRELIGLGKLRVEGGMLRNNRVDRMVDKSTGRLKVPKKLGRSSEHSPRQRSLRQRCNSA